MITFQGWATVREAFDEAGESDTLFNSIENELEKKLGLLVDGEANLFIKLRSFNGELKLLVAGAANHKTATWYKALELFEWLSKNAVGSYGLLHLHDDEDKDGLSNDFQVYCLKKGTLEKAVEPLLSPVIPSLEDV